MQNDLKCTDMCRRRECTNQFEENESEDGLEDFMDIDEEYD
jgi:hypothetical protein